MIEAVEMSHIPAREKNKYKLLLKENIDVFSKSSTDIGKANTFMGFVKVKPGMDPADFQAKHIPIPMHLRKETQKLCNQLLAAGVVNTPLNRYHA